MKPSYLTDELDRANERYQYYVHSFEQSRRFRGLKVWMSFKRYGASQIGEWIDNNVRQAKHLYSAVAKHPEFEAAAAGDVGNLQLISERRPKRSAIQGVARRGSEASRTEWEILDGPRN